jgi:hypothetical protein
MQTRFKPSMNDNVGYMFMIVDKEWYWPGQVVEGRIFFETFLPCFQNKLMLKFEGVESFPQHLTSQVFKDFLSSLPKDQNSQKQDSSHRHLKRLETRIL